MGSIDDETARECAKILKEYCKDRGCQDCPISCRWDGNTRIPTQIPALWNIVET